MSCDIKSYYGYLDQQNAQNSPKNVSVFVAVFLYAVTMLIFQIERIISGERHGLTTPFLFFFFENVKNLGRSDDAKRRKKKGMA